jgi:crotonobetainyl-CoA:carnitine CoA-transferase CaiB-like acyl-CoA transferase
MILGDLGADVLKIEEAGPVTGRRAEQAGAAGASQPGIKAEADPFDALERNKRSIGLNLKAPEAREIFYKLVKDADVVVEGFRPGTTKRLGVDYDALKKLNPRIIYCAITGYGQTGPYATLVGHDINYISHAGVLSTIGNKGGKPVIPHNFLADFAGGGMHGAIGVMAAIIARQKTGRGQMVDISMMDGVMLVAASMISSYFRERKIYPRGEAYLTGALPHFDVYECKDGKYVSLGSLEPWFYANLCRAMGREDFIPHQNTTGPKREEIRAYFAQQFKTKTRDEWFDVLAQTDICVGHVYGLDELESAPQVKARNMVVYLDHPKKGKVPQVGIAPKLSDTPGMVRSFGPALGQHTDEVLKGLGYKPAEVAKLRAAGAIK